MLTLELEAIKHSYQEPSQALSGGATASTALAGARSRQVLCGANLRIEPGTLVAVMGQSGSGKSTLLRIAGGLDRPDEGRVRLAGVALESLPEAQRRRLRRTHLAFVFPSGNLLETLTARENVELSVEGLGLTAKGRASRVDGALMHFGLESLAQRFPHQLSSGEQQRIAVARTLARRPPLVICDEPTAHLDEANASHLARALRELTSAGVACLLATHDLIVAKQAHRVLRLSGGCLIAADEESKN